MVLPRLFATPPGHTYVHITTSRPELPSWATMFPVGLAKPGMANLSRPTSTPGNSLARFPLGVHHKSGPFDPMLEGLHAAIRLDALVFIGQLFYGLSFAVEQHSKHANLLNHQNMER